MVEAGYKQTEIGVIPENWKIMSADSLCTKIQDGTHFSPTLGGGDFLYITSKNIGRGFLKLNNIETISESEHRNIYERCDVKRGDLLLTKDGVNTGNVALNTLEEEFSLLSSVAFLRFDTKKYVAGFFLQYILSDIGQSRLQTLMSGNAITRLTVEKIRAFTFPVPTKEEQQIISKTLSDVDELLAGLDALIAKKRAVKQGAMQQLLTGRTRLPEFESGVGMKETEIGLISAEWEVATLNSLLDESPTYGINAPSVKFRLDLPVYIRITDINEDGHFAPSETVCVDHALSDSYILNNGDIVFARTGASVGKSYLYKESDGKLVYAGFLIKIHPNASKLNPEFLAQFVQTSVYWNWVNVMSMRSGQPGINGKEYGQLQLQLPSIKEQKAIAAILSDMDTEIATLESRRAKTAKLKQGMMQELLTGRTRLVSPTT